MFMPTVWCQPSISPGFSSESRLSFYLIKHPRDALEVIGFSTRGNGHRAECVCVCVYAVSLIVYVCYVSLLVLVSVRFVFAVNHWAFRKLN